LRLALKIYGIKNCDTMKKARSWLDARSIAYTFHDYKVEGIDRATLETWSKVVGWDRVLNCAGTTFRKLPDAERGDLNEAKAIRLMISQPSMSKRPVLELRRTVLVGFSPESYEKALVQA
jgi:arsenate reductase (glutaredoxin)